MKDILNLKTLFISLGRNKLHSAINITGFTVSLTVVILLWAYIMHEVSVDSWHSRGDDIYVYSGDKSALSTRLLGPELQARYPEIESSTTMLSTEYIIGCKGRFTECSTLVTDSSFFSMLDYKLLSGDRGSLFRKGRFEALVSSGFAFDNFGTSDCVGEKITFPVIPGMDVARSDVELMPVEIVGVYEDFERTLLGHHDLIVSFDLAGYRNQSMPNDWNTCNYLTYFLMKPGCEPEGRVDEINSYLMSVWWKYKNSDETTARFVKLKDAYFDPVIGSHFITRTNSLTGIYAFGAASMLVLIFAIINYINLSIAQSSTRAREFATRRLLGASRAGLMIRMIVESLLICGICFVMALILSIGLSGRVATIMGVGEPLLEGYSYRSILLAAVFILLLGVVCGILPGIVLSSYKPIDITSGAFLKRTKQTFSKIMISVQYVLTIVITGCTLILVKQIVYMRDFNPGFNKENIFVVSRYSGVDTEAFYREVCQMPEVVNGMKMNIGLGGSMNCSYVDKSGGKIQFECFYATPEVFDLMGYKIEKRYASDTTDFVGIWINETMERALPQGAIDMPFSLNNKMYGIKGVIRDFNHKSLSAAITPVMLTVDDSPIGYQYAFRINDGHADDIVPKIRESFERHTGNMPFGGFFLDDYMGGWYKKEEARGQLIGMSAIVAIILAAMGLLGMSTYFIALRAKEFSIRKIYGSTNGKIISDLIVYFSGMILITSLVSMPLISFIMKPWLEGFTSNPDSFIDCYAGSFLIIGVISLGMIYFLGNKAVKSSPRL